MTYVTRKTSDPITKISPTTSKRATALAPKARAVWRVVVKAVEEDDVRFSVKLTTGQITSLIGKNVTFTVLMTDGSTRYFNGYVQKFGLDEIGRGQPAKRLNGGHAKSLLRHKLANNALGRSCNAMLRAVPASP